MDDIQKVLGIASSSEQQHPSSPPSHTHKKRYTHPHHDTTSLHHLHTKKEKPGIDVVLGSQWGDEGKGKLVDILSQASSI